MRSDIDWDTEIILTNGLDECDVLWPQLGRLLTLIGFLTPQRAQFGVIFGA